MVWLVFELEYDIANIEEVKRHIRVVPWVLKVF